MTLDEAGKVVARVAYRNWLFLIYPYGAFGYVQATIGDNTWPMKSDAPRSRKWLLSEHMTESEVVQTCLLLVLTALEHEAREEFQYEGKALFHPHHGLAGLRQIIDLRDERQVP
jgi:hypothetical protein